MLQAGLPCREWPRYMFWPPSLTCGLWSGRSYEFYEGLILPVRVRHDKNLKMESFDPEANGLAIELSYYPSRSDHQKKPET